jgi:hypothetical protein
MTSETSKEATQSIRLVCLILHPIQITNPVKYMNGNENPRGKSQSVVRITQTAYREYSIGLINLKCKGADLLLLLFWK